MYNNMDINAIQVASLLITLLEQEIETGEPESFEVFCDENIENEEQKSILNQIKDHVDYISGLLTSV